jgi:hypothetical protein
MGPRGTEPSFWPATPPSMVVSNLSTVALSFCVGIFPIDLSNEFGVKMSIYLGQADNLICVSKSASRMGAQDPSHVKWRDCDVASANRQMDPQ